MSVRIVATGLYAGDADRCLDHLVLAAERCLEKADIGREDVDLLLYVGSTRPDFIYEPSVAALLQKRLGINPRFADHFAGRSTLSFDLSNGNCGFLVACQCFDALARVHGLRHALVVASDVHHDGGRAEPFVPMSAAALLRAGSSGFRGSTLKRSSGQGPGMLSVVDLRNPPTASYRFDFEPGFADRAVELLSATLREHPGPLPERWICAEPVPGIGSIATRVAEDLPSVPRIRISTEGLHTTAHIVGFASHEGGPLLFAACGAGPVAMVATYEE